VQLNFSMPDRIKECWRKSSNQYWGKPELIGQLALKCLWDTSCAEPHTGSCGGWGLETPGYSIIRFMPDIISQLIRLILKNVSWLAIQGFTDGVQCRKTDRSSFSCLQNRQILYCNSDCFSQLLLLHFSLRENDIDVNNNGHIF